jgi:hypothetical protein
LSSATAKGTGEATSSPIVCNLLLTIKGVGSLVWNTDEVSEFDYTVNTNPPNGPITLSAFITSGRLAGDTITAVPLSAHPNPDCALNGLSRLTSEASLVTFTH